MNRPLPPDSIPRPLMSVATSWHSPWLLTALSEHGLSHYEQGHPNQDAYAVAHAGPHLILAVADGMSSQPLSHLGARIAVNAAVATLVACESTKPTINDMRAAFAAAHAALESHAQATGNLLDDFGATLAVVVLTGTHIVAGSVGDSSVSVHTRTGSKAASTLAPFLSSPQPLEDGAYSITSPDWDRAFAARAATYPGLISVVVNSDGGNTFLESHDATHPGTPPTLTTETLDGLPATLADFGPRQFALFWAGYLASQPASGFDDRTLLIAYRPDVPLPLGC